MNLNKGRHFIANHSIKKKRKKSERRGEDTILIVSKQMKNAKKKIDSDFEVRWKKVAKESIEDERSEKKEK